MLGIVMVDFMDGNRCVDYRRLNCLLLHHGLDVLSVFSLSFQVDKCIAPTSCTW